LQFEYWMNILQEQKILNILVSNARKRVALNIRTVFTVRNVLHTLEHTLDLLI